MPLPLKTEYVPRSGVPGGVGAGAVVVAAVVVVVVLLVVGGAVVVAWSAVQMLSAMTRIWKCISGSHRKC